MRLSSSIAKAHERRAAEVAKEATKGLGGPTGSQDHGADVMWLMGGYRYGGKGFIEHK